MADVNEVKGTGTVNPIGEYIRKGSAIFMGIHEKSGSFEDEKGKTIDFHNFLITLAFEAEGDNSTVNIYGSDCVQYKVKAAELLDVFNAPAGAEWYSFFKPDEWLYKPVDVSFKRKADRNGNLVLSHISKVD